MVNAYAIIFLFLLLQVFHKDAHAMILARLKPVAQLAHGAIPSALRKVMALKFPEFDKYQLGIGHGCSVSVFSSIFTLHAYTCLIPAYICLMHLFMRSPITFFDAEKDFEAIIIITFFNS